MDFISILLSITGNPIQYSIIFFIYVILAALILPIPVEIGLFNPNIHPIWLISILAVGKGIGSLIAFEIGKRVRDTLKKRSSEKKRLILGKIIFWCEKFVIKYGYYGLFIIMSMPLMIDSATLYLFSLLNPKEGKGKRVMARKWFVLINIAAGATRGSIIFIIAYFIGVKLV
jgi:membrane protein YqaA with SNARE-associated domain